MGEPLLDAAGQVVLALGRDEGELAAISKVVWLAILEPSIALRLTSCRQVMLTRRKQCKPRPRKSQPSAHAAWGSASRTALSRMELSPEG